MKKKLKQPHKYTHQFLDKNQENDDSSSEKEGQDKITPKHKLIQKEKYVRKVINKPNEPSALRLEQINKTFENLSEKSENFIQGLHINHNLLRQLQSLQTKFVCKCKRNIKYYCLKCDSKCDLLQIQQIKIPLRLHIIHHTSQKINKSSVAPMRFLTNDISFYPFAGKDISQNKIQVFNKIPKPSASTYILYPHKNSKSLKEINEKIEDLIIFDCTWFQTDQVIQQMQDINYTNFIKLEGYESIFWRYNHHGSEALSSAESILYFFRQFQTINGKNEFYYDNLMLLYALNMKMVSNSMKQQQ